MFRIASGVIAREVEGDLLVLDVDSELIHQFNEAARLVWQACEQSCSAAQVAERLADAYEVERHVAMEDAVKMLEQLRTLKLIVPA